MKRWEKILWLFFFSVLVLVFIGTVMRNKKEPGHKAEISRTTESQSIGRVSKED